MQSRFLEKEYNADPYLSISYWNFIFYMKYHVGIMFACLQELLNEKRLSGVFLPVLRSLPPRVTGFSLVAAGRTKGLKNRARLPMPGSGPQLFGYSMESSFLPYLMAVMWMSFLLLLSVWLRAKVTFLQKYLVPAGIIAGTLGFALINVGG